MEIQSLLIFVAGLASGALLVSLAAWVLIRQMRYDWEQRQIAADAQSNEKIKIFEEMERRLEGGFASMTGRALRESTDAFFGLAKQSFSHFESLQNEKSQHQIGAIEQRVQPLVQALQGLDDKIQKLEQSRAGAYSGLSQLVQSLGESQQELRRETSMIRESLRSSTAKGRWGELQLRRIVELSGMKAHCDFYEQEEILEDSTDQKMRPDMIIRLAGDRTIVVDAKVPTQPAAIRRHILDLGNKNYWRQFERSPEFVVMFMPGDYFLAEALDLDADLLEFAFKLKVHIATPSTLITMLKSIAYGLREEKIAQEAQEILQIGKTLYARIKDFSDSYGVVGQRMRQLNDAFNRSVTLYERKLIPIAKDFAGYSLGEAEGREDIKTPPFVGLEGSQEASDTQQVL